MTNFSIKIPDKLYCGFQQRGENEILGFLTPFGTDRAFEKRKSTVDDWAQRTRGQAVMLEAKTFDNVLLSGFRIDRHIKRYGWNSNNSVIRVEDPRGFELEISTANLCKLIENNTIVNGEIQARCIWGRDGARNVLLAENSQPYLDARQNMQRLNTTVSLRDVQPGNIVLLKNGDTVTYLGKAYVSTLEYSGPNEKRKLHISKPRLMHAKLANKYQEHHVEFSSSLPVSKIIDYQVLSENERRDRINQDDNASQGLVVFFNATPAVLFTKPVKVDVAALDQLKDNYYLDLELDNPTIDNVIVLEHKQSGSLFWARAQVSRGYKLGGYTLFTLYRIFQFDQNEIVYSSTSRDIIERVELGLAMQTYNFYGLYIKQG